MEGSHMFKASTVAVAGCLAVAGMFFAIAFMSPGAGPNGQDEAAQVQLAREAAAKRLARTIKWSAPVISANTKTSASGLFHPAQASLAKMPRGRKPAPLVFEVAP